MNSLLLLTKKTLGQVEPEDRAFGESMLLKFLHNLEGQAQELERVILYTEGVKLAIKGSESALSLQFLCDSGVEVLLCQSCLEYYGLDPQELVGEVSNMQRIATYLAQANHIISP